MVQTTLGGGGEILWVQTNGRSNKISVPKFSGLKRNICVTKNWCQNLWVLMNNFVKIWLYKIWVPEQLRAIKICFQESESTKIWVPKIWARTISGSKIFGYFSFMLDYAQKCRIRSQNGINQILAKLEHIFGITQNFIKNLLNIQ